MAPAQCGKCRPESHPSIVVAEEGRYSLSENQGEVACNDSPSPNGVPILARRAFHFVSRFISFRVSSYTTWGAQFHVCVGSVPSMATPTVFVIWGVIDF